MLHLCFNVEVSKRKFWAITSSFDRISLSLGCWLCRALAHGCCEQNELAGPWANELVNLVNLSELGELVDDRTCGSPFFTLSKTLCKLTILQLVSGIALWGGSMKSRQSMTFLSKLSFSCAETHLCQTLYLLVQPTHLCLLAARLK